MPVVSQVNADMAQKLVEALAEENRGLTMQWPRQFFLINALCNATMLLFATARRANCVDCWVGAVYVGHSVATFSIAVWSLAVGSS